MLMLCIRLCFRLAPVLSLLVFACLFINCIKSWATCLRMNSVGGAHGKILPQRMPSTCPKEYLLMSSLLVCQCAKPYLIILVTSAPANKEVCRAIRDTRGGEVKVRDYQIITSFMLGQILDPAQTKQPTDEARENRHLVQGRLIPVHCYSTSVLTFAGTRKGGAGRTLAETCSLKGGIRQ